MLRSTVQPWYQIAIHDVAICDIHYRTSKNGGHWHGDGDGGLSERMKALSLMAGSRTRQARALYLLAAHLLSFTGRLLINLPFTSCTCSLSRPLIICSRLLCCVAATVNHSPPTYAGHREISDLFGSSTLAWGFLVSHFFSVLLHPHPAKYRFVSNPAR